MLSTETLQQADLYFRTFLHVVVPLQRCLIAEMCRLPAPPLELATRLEDIGHAFIGMAGDLTGTLIDRGRMEEEPDPDDYAEARIDRFVEALIAGSGVLKLADGTRVEGPAALSALPVVADAIKTALWVARAGKAREPGAAE